MTARHSWLRSGALGVIALGVSVLVACADTSATTEYSSGSLPASALSHVHAVDVDDERERVTVATHEGFVSIDISPTGQPSAAPTSLGDYRGDVMGFVRLDDELLLSGHPAAGSSEAPNVGVLRADLNAAQWQPLALSGEVDFHAMSYSNVGGSSLVAGLDSSTGVVMTSDDRGVTWRRGTSIAARDLAVGFSGSLLFATTEDGPQVSDDRGQTWRTIEPAPLLVLVDSGFDTDGLPLMVGVDVDGVLHASSDGFEWQSWKTLPFTPEALGVGDRGTIVIVSTQLVMMSKDSGQSWSQIANITLPAVRVDD